MRRVRLVLLLTSMVCLSACACWKSAAGGAGSAGDAMGEGNIPLAQPGDELGDINFAFDSSALSSTAKGILTENSQWILDNPESNVVVEGHCDERGTKEYNYALGQRRAQAAYDFLRSLGVKQGQMETISYGEDLPLDPRSSEEAWAKNRRSHFAIK